MPILVAQLLQIIVLDFESIGYPVGNTALPANLGLPLCPPKEGSSTHWRPIVVVGAYFSVHKAAPHSAKAQILHLLLRELQSQRMLRRIPGSQVRPASDLHPRAGAGIWCCICRRRASASTTSWACVRGTDAACAAKQAVCPRRMKALSASGGWTAHVVPR
mmetsp:Transcript_22301/g.37899  ORF Transcript_22301/g.37899 Transcript_22301/m.37899 type:complete len:161 (-) Transcript_22301:422-904(-)